MAVSGHHHAPGCPFMPGEQAMCEMNAFDHIAAWQSTFTTTLPVVFVLTLFTALAFVFTWRLWYPPPDLVLASVTYRQRAKVPLVPLYQQLFSRGILNPKIP